MSQALTKFASMRDFMRVIASISIVTVLVADSRYDWPVIAA
jgi:hypothetical protein